METAILGAGLFVFTAHLLDAFFEKTRIPDILLLMVLGLLIGPVLGLLTTDDFGQVGPFLSVLTLLVILFESGLSLRIKALLDSAGRAAPFSIISMLLAIAGLAGATHLMLGLDPMMSLLGGFIMGGTSSAVVIPMLKALKAGEETMTVLMLESTVTDVFCIIGTVGIATSLAAGEGLAATGLLGGAAFSLLVASGMGVLFGGLWAVLHGRVARLQDNLFTTLAFAMVVYGLAETLEISGAIAALCFGITLGNLPKGLVLTVGRGTEGDSVELTVGEVSTEERKVYSETVFLLKAAFFFYLGMQVHPSDFFSANGLAALVLAAVPFLPRYPVVRLGLDKTTTTRREALLATMLVPRGLAAAVLAQIPLALELPGGEMLAETVAMMVFLSITLVSATVFLVERGVLDMAGTMLFGPFVQEAPAQLESVDVTATAEPEEANPTAGAADDSAAGGSPSEDHENEG